VNPVTQRSTVRRRTLLQAVGAASFVSLAGPAAAEHGSSVTGIDAGRLRLDVIGRYESGRFDEGGAEIVDYHAPTRQVFVINADIGGVDILDVADPAVPTKVGDIDVSGDLEGMSTANSVWVGDDIVAVAIEAETAQDPGRVGLYDPETFELLGSAVVGALPDKVTLTPDGQYALVANEGEPNAAYDVDPRGSVSILDLTEGPANPTVRTATFTQYDGQEDDLRERGIRIFGPEASAAQDFEPEYVTVSDDSTTAWVSLQENNAIAEIDIATAEISALWPLGFKDHREPGNALDASNEDGGVSIRNWPIYGMLQPDSIGAYNAGDETYLVTANEGDARDYEGFSEEAEIGELDLDPEGFEFEDIADIDGIDELQQPEHLGAKGVTTTRGDIDDDGRYEELHRRRCWTTSTTGISASTSRPISSQGTPPRARPATSAPRDSPSQPQPRARSTSRWCSSATRSAARPRSLQCGATPPTTVVTQRMRVPTPGDRLTDPLRARPPTSVAMTVRTR